jgi:hypothetical protein
MTCRKARKVARNKWLPLGNGCGSRPDRTRFEYFRLRTADRPQCASGRRTHTQRSITVCDHAVLTFCSSSAGSRRKGRGATPVRTLAAEPANMPYTEHQDIAATKYSTNAVRDIITAVHQSRWRALTVATHGRCFRMRRVTWQHCCSLHSQGHQTRCVRLPMQNCDLNALFDEFRSGCEACGV